MMSGPKLVLLVFVNLALFIAVFFIFAGSLSFWQGWVYITVTFVPEVFNYAYFYKHDPQLFERRLQPKEKTREQKLLRRCFAPIRVIGFALAVLDYRFGWSRTYLGGVPLWLEVISQALVLGGSLFVFWAMKVNSFASRTIQVESGQATIANGPYRFVRHPLYLGRLLTTLFTAPALGSYVAWPFGVLYVFFFVFRLLNEESILHRELPGYGEYCLRTRFRLVPYLW